MGKEITDIVDFCILYDSVGLLCCDRMPLFGVVVVLALRSFVAGK